MLVAQTFQPVVTTGSVRRMLFVLAVPVLTEQLLNALVGIGDTFWAGRVSAVATNAIGLAAYVAWLASMLFAMVGTGTTALVSRFWGARQPEEANDIAHQAILLAAAIGVATSAALMALAPVFARMQGMSGESGRIAVTYLRLNAISAPMLSVTLAGSAALRGAGDMRTPMAIQAAINVVNMIVSPCLLYGLGPLPALGVDGIALGTVTAETLGAAIMIVLLVRGRAGLRLRPSRFRPEAARIGRIMRIGIPAGADGVIMWSGHFVFLIIIAYLATGAIGDAYYAAHIVAVRTEAFTYLPAIAWGTAAATMIGQALGAGDAKRAIRAGHEAVLQCGLLNCVVAVLFYAGAEQIYAIMHTDALVRAAGVTPFRILALLQPVLGMSIVYIHGMRGAGDTRFPMLITLIGIIVVRLPIGYVCGTLLSGGLLGAWMGMCADIIWRALAALIRYRGHRWVHTRV
ncbi:MAG: MATE family efflux transporter [Phycisphaerales bacterium]|nr:MAG: MATE family efflux transporter [Phycisphaerales bacterium]